MSKKTKRQVSRLIYKIIFVFALIMVIVSAVWLVSDYLQKQEARRIYESLAEAAKNTTEVVTTPPETETETEEETTTAPYVSPIDFAALSEVNSEVVAWITVPDTNIDYPIVYSPDSNEKYLHMDFEGNESVVGTIYLDIDDKPDFSSLHNVMYGHHMRNGSMFKDIVKYKEKDFFDTHRDIYLYTPEKEFHLRACSVLYTDPGAVRRQTVFTNNEEFQQYVIDMTDGCSYKDVPEDGVKQLFSFVTCSYEFENARTILYAYEVDEDGNPVPYDGDDSFGEKLPELKSDIIIK